jgi:undecaprenol kinase
VRSSSFPHAVRHAWAGMTYAFRSQWNMRAHVAIAILVLVAAATLHVRRPYVVELILVIGLVLGLELLNTAIEATVDLLSPAEHPLAKVAKDCAAGAVLVAAASAVAIGLLVFTAP